MRSPRWLRSASLLAGFPMCPLVAQAPNPIAASWSVEYLAPTKADRRIQTVSADLGLAYTLSTRHQVAVGLSLTPTYAVGHIFQLDSTLQRVRYETSALGIGPTVRLRALPIPLGPIRLGVEGSAGLLLYTERFPAGGDYYNGMLRAGPIAGITVSPSTRLLLSAKWTHVSNGQGLGPFNPSYEAWAFSMGADHQLAVGRGPALRRGRILWPALLGGLAGAASGAALSRRCDDGTCRIGGGITAVGALTGASIAVLLANL